MPDENSLPFNSKISRRYSAIILMLLLVLSCFALVLSASAFRDRINEIRATDSDNGGWVVAQLDVDYKALLLAAQEGLLDPDFREVATGYNGFRLLNLKFDVFYSRVDIVLGSLSNAAIDQELTTRLHELERARDDLAAEIDVIKAGDIRAVAQFTISIRKIGNLVRDVTTMALQFHVKETENARAKEQELLARFWIQSLVLLILMTISAFLALRLWRELEGRASQMRRALSLITKAFEAPLEAVIIANLEGDIRMVNLGASKIFGVPRKQLIGKNIKEVMIPPRFRSAHQTGMEKHRLSGHRKMIGAGATRVTAMRLTGEEFPAEVSIAADTDVDGSSILIGFIRDISDVVAAEERLLAARDEAERHASAKTMFLATMSHEMRTPLHGLLASLDLLDTTALDTYNRKLIQTARDCSQRALQQINDVLEITRLGENKEGRAPFRPADVVAEILNELTPLAKKRDIALELKISGEPVENRLFLGLASTFSRAIYNLAGNAVKFTEHGEVTVTLHFTHVTLEQASLRVEVKDTGIGIAAEDQERIFGEFEVVASGERTRNGGTGLGLPIVRLAVNRMGGVLTLVSAPMLGSEFSFEIILPFASETYDPPVKNFTEPAVVSSGFTVRALNVLVVDDDDTNVALLAEMVRRSGHTPSIARNGLEAVALASMHQYDVILMDVSMPLMDGLEATEHIRSGGISSSARIIGVTAYTNPERIDKLCKTGMNLVLTKPVSQHDIKKTLNHPAGNDPICSDVKSDSVGKWNSTDFNKALKALSELVGEDSAVQFFEEIQDEVSTLLRSLGGNPVANDEVANRLHRIAGSTAMIGLSYLSNFLLSAEEVARANNQSALRKILSEITKISNANSESLKAYPRL